MRLILRTAFAVLALFLAGGSQAGELSVTRASHTDHAGLYGADDLRSLALMQVLRPSNDPRTFEILGTHDLADWFQLGNLRLLHGQVPPPVQGRDDRAAMKMIVGSLDLLEGPSFPYVVASVAYAGPAAHQPEDSLLFVVHSIADSRREAQEMAHRSTRALASLPGVDTGDEPLSESNASAEVPEGGLESVFGEIGEGCLAACQNAFNIKMDGCNSSYTTCVGSATALYALCNLTCGPTVGAGCLACAAAYYIALAVCDSNLQSCRTGARADKQACDAGCPTEEEVPFCPDDDPTNCTPIVLNLDGRGGFRFTSAEEGVAFDLDGDGALNRTAWTTPGHSQAFLVLDRNGNGTIDDGRELFGGVTLQPDSAEPNGFRALAVLDSEAAGGNSNGRIDEGDLAFSLLKLWNDDDQDGVSQPRELTGLAEAGVEWIDTEYVINHRRDSHGNLLRYRAQVRMNDRMTQCVDVIFVQNGRTSVK